MHVVDENDTPVSGIAVRLSYENYSAEDTAHQETTISDVNGNVHFQKHQHWTILLKRIFYTAKSANAFVHASFGPQATVFAFGNGMEGEVVFGGYIYFWQGKPDKLTSTIIVHKRT